MQSYDRRDILFLIEMTGQSALNIYIKLFQRFTLRKYRMAQCFSGVSSFWSFLYQKDNFVNYHNILTSLLISDVLITDVLPSGHLIFLYSLLYYTQRFAAR